MKFILKPSSIVSAGIGVFALDPIKTGERLVLLDVPKGFRMMKEIDIPDEFLKYCPLLESGEYLCPQHFHAMNIFWYLNHSNTPNVEWGNGKFVSKDDIQHGDELTIFYPDLATHPKNKLWNETYIRELGL